eukprot:2650545-Rhodomonas_salina.1
MMRLQIPKYAHLCTIMVLKFSVAVRAGQPEKSPALQGDIEPRKLVEHPVTTAAWVWMPASVTCVTLVRVAAPRSDGGPQH